MALTGNHTTGQIGHVEDHNALDLLKADKTELHGYVSFGTTDPSTYLPSGTEYVWNKTDGAGTLLDIVSGVA